MYETLLFVPIVFTNLLITSLKCLLLVALLCYLHSSLARVKKFLFKSLFAFYSFIVFLHASFLHLLFFPRLILKV